MNSLQHLFAILRISQDTLCMKLQQCVGESNEDVNAFCTNWILGEIEQQYEAVCDNLQILEFLEKSRSSIDGKDVQMRLMLYGVVKGYNYYEGPATAIMQPLEKAIENHETMRSYRKFLYKVISQLDIPAPSRMYGCVRLFEYEDCREFVKERLQELFTIGTVIDRYYALCAYKHICSYNKFIRRSDRDCSVNDFYETVCFTQGTMISGEGPNILSEEVKLYLQQIGKEILTNDEDDVSFEVKLTMRPTQPLGEHSGGTTVFYQGFETVHIVGGTTCVPLNCTRTIVGKHHQKEYTVKILQQVYFVFGGGYGSYNYSKYDYYCMIGLVTNNPAYTASYFDVNIFYDIFAPIGRWLLTNGIPVQDVFYEFIGNTRKKSPARIKLAKTLKSLCGGIYVQRAYDLLKQDMSIMISRYKKAIESLLLPDPPLNEAGNTIVNASSNEGTVATSAMDNSAPHEEVIGMETEQEETENGVEEEEGEEERRRREEEEQALADVVANSIYDGL